MDTLYKLCVIRLCRSMQNYQNSFRIPAIQRQYIQNNRQRYRQNHKVVCVFSKIVLRHSGTAVAVHICLTSAVNANEYSALRSVHLIAHVVLPAPNGYEFGWWPKPDLSKRNITTPIAKSIASDFTAPFRLLWMVLWKKGRVMYTRRARWITSLALWNWIPQCICLQQRGYTKA
jgi:hypothetical protein